MGERAAFREMRMKARIWMAIFAAAFFLAELIIGLYGRGFIRSYMGDVLIIPFLYCAAQIFLLRQDYILTAVLFVMGIAAEVLQYMEAGSRLGIPKNSFLGILLGATGDVMDVVCYGVGTGMVCAGILLYKRRKADRLPK